MPPDWIKSSFDDAKQRLLENAKKKSKAEIAFEIAYDKRREAFYKYQEFVLPVLKQLQEALYPDRLPAQKVSIGAEIPSKDLGVRDLRYTSWEWTLGYNDLDTSGYGPSRYDAVTVKLEFDSENNPTAFVCRTGYTYYKKQSFWGKTERISESRTGLSQKKLIEALKIIRQNSIAIQTKTRGSGLRIKLRGSDLRKCGATGQYRGV
jgi:hypothetical protein